MIYLDASAVFKLIIEEPESAGLEAWLGRHPAARFSSELVRTEVRLAVRRRGVLDSDRVAQQLAQCDLVPVTGRLLDSAGSAFDAGLRTQHAIHLATAMFLRTDLTWFVAYDRRLLAAAEAAGLPTAAPG